MTFVLTKGLKLIQETARAFADDFAAPRAAQVDRTGVFPRESIAKAADLGFLGMLIPDAYGGSYIVTLGMVLVMEEINRACGSTGVTLSVHNSLVSVVLEKYGTEEQRRNYLPRMARGEILGAYSLSEPGSGSDAASLQTTAVRNGDGYVVNGRKDWVTNGGEAEIYLLYATVDRSLRSKGITAFLVEKGTPGFSVGKHEKKLGIRGSTTTELIFEGCRIPASARLGEEGQGFKIAMEALDGGRIGIAAQAIGIARASLETSIAYAKQRHQFGRPIADFQAIQWKIADTAMEIDAARLLTWRAAWLKDQGLPHTREASMAKLYASETANRAATRAVQIHGGAGYTKEFPVERYFRDAKITEIYEGTSEVQRMVIARNVIK